MSLKLGSVGILTSGLPHDTSGKHLADFEEEHGCEVFGNMLLAAGDIKLYRTNWRAAGGFTTCLEWEEHLGTVTALYPLWEAQLRHCPSL